MFKKFTSHELVAIECALEFYRKTFGDGITFKLGNKTIKQITEEAEEKIRKHIIIVGII
jgi:hypothetical protein